MNEMKVSGGLSKGDGSKAAGWGSAAILAGAALPQVHAVENNTVEVVLVGCGGRGTGAVMNALSTESGPTRLVAMADVFASHLENSLRSLSDRRPKQVDVPKERQFIGFDAYKRAIDALKHPGVVILATPPVFRPLHLEYAVEKGVHVFMEKSFAVDGPGVRRVLKAGKKADSKNLKVAGGLMSRHYPPLEKAVDQLHQGRIGEILSCCAYREHGPVGFNPKEEGMTEMAHQIRNYSNFTWLNGSFLLDWLIHNLDVCCWVKGAWPVSAQGQGGRQVRSKPDQLFDHYAVEYQFGDDTRLYTQGRHMVGCWSFFGDIVYAQRGSAVLGEGIPEPRIYKSYDQSSDEKVWQAGPGPNPYQVEHDRLFQAIREDVPYNETERCAYAAMTGILGRMAVESGEKVTWQEGLESDLELAPRLGEYAMESEPPVMPNPDGSYPVATPGETKAF